ncbi:MAG: nuclear transport factor 2 family protein [Pseudomonadota bacterium]
MLMKRWSHLLLSLSFACAVSTALHAESTDTDQATVLAELLNTFLAGASRGDRSVHERFWDDGLVYTSSAGSRTTKAQILGTMDDTPSDTPPEVVYTADDVDIRLYGDMAVVAFTLVATPQGDATTEPSYYLNTGTFRLTDSHWRAVAWQATRVPE